MARDTISFQLLVIASLLASFTSAQCNTDQNPSCGNVLFASLCCPAPAVCYWKSRNGEPGCCPGGQVCLDGEDFGQSSVGQVTATTFFVMTTYTSTGSQALMTTQSTSTAPTQSFATVSSLYTPAVVVITTATPIVSTVPVSSPNGAFVTANNPQYLARGSKTIMSAGLFGIILSLVLVHVAF